LAREQKGRMLVIDPSVTTCERIAATLIQRGHRVKMVHGKDRDVPDDDAVHIVATQIVDAGITIKNLAVVIDTGYVISNDRGDLATRRLDRATGEQRAGRTGRQCPGEYYRLGPYSDDSTTPYPSIQQVLGEHPIASAYPITITLDRANVVAECEVPFDKYATFREPLNSASERYSLGTYHQLRLAGLTYGAALNAYATIGTREISDELAFLVDKFPPRCVPMTLESLKASIAEHPIVYSQGRAPVVRRPRMVGGKVVLTDEVRQRRPQNFERDEFSIQRDDEVAPQTRNDAEAVVEDDSTALEGPLPIVDIAPDFSEAMAAPVLAPSDGPLVPRKRGKRSTKKSSGARDGGTPNAS